MKRITSIILVAIVASALAFVGCKKDTPSPVADFSANKTTAYAYQDVTFSDLTTGSPTSWSWAFTSGTPATSTSQSPVVYWATNGAYNVSLTATNANGSSSTSKSNYVTVKPNFTLWSNFNGGTINVYISTSPLNSANFLTAYEYHGTIDSYFTSAPDCGSSGCYSLNAYGTIYYYALDGTYTWSGSTNVTDLGCNTLNFTTSKTNSVMEVCSICEGRSVTPTGHKK